MSDGNVLSMWGFEAGGRAIKGGNNAKQTLNNTTKYAHFQGQMIFVISVVQGRTT